MMIPANLRIYESIVAKLVAVSFILYNLKSHGHGGKADRKRLERLSLSESIPLLVTYVRRSEAQATVSMYRAM